LQAISEEEEEEVEDPADDQEAIEHRDSSKPFKDTIPPTTF
jgi:hypothetical protein